MYVRCSAKKNNNAHVIMQSSAFIRYISEFFSPATAINFIFKTLAINDNVTDRTKSKAFYTRLMLTNSRSSLKTIKHCQQNLTQPTMIRSLVGRVGVRSSKLQQSSINRTEMAIASGEWVKVCKRFIWFYMALAHAMLKCCGCINRIMRDLSDFSQLFLLLSLALSLSIFPSLFITFGCLHLEVDSFSQLSMQDLPSVKFTEAVRYASDLMLYSVTLPINVLAPRIPESCIILNIWEEIITKLPTTIELSFQFYPSLSLTLPLMYHKFLFMMC